MKGDADLDGVKSLEGKLHMALSEHSVLVQFLRVLVIFGIDMAITSVVTH